MGVAPDLRPLALDGGPEPPPQRRTVGSRTAHGGGAARARLVEAGGDGFGLVEHAPDHLLLLLALRLGLAPRAPGGTRRGRVADVSRACVRLAPSRAG